MRHRIECWIENGLREPQSPSDRRTRSIRWPRDSRLLKLALACCTAGAVRTAVADEDPPWNLREIAAVAWVSASSSESFAEISTNGYQTVPADASTIILPARSCAGYEWCKSACSAGIKGGMEILIGSQSILIATYGGDVDPYGRVDLTVRIDEPTYVSGTLLDSSNPDCQSLDFEQGGDYPLACDLALAGGGASLLFSAPMQLLFIDVDTGLWNPGQSWKESKGSFANCDLHPDWGYELCSEPLHGTWRSEAVIDHQDGLHCFCGNEIPGWVEASARSISEVSVDGNRLDIDFRYAWGCPDCVGYFNSWMIVTLGINRPVRVTWDYACGQDYHASGIFGNVCGPGSTELWPYSYGGTQYYTSIWLFAIANTFDPEPWSEPLEREIVRFRATNVRIERLFPADVVFDGVVDGSDVAAILSKWGGPYVPHWTAADVNLDGQVGAEDLAEVLFAWGTPG